MWLLDTHLRSEKTAAIGRNVIVVATCAAGLEVKLFLFGPFIEFMVVMIELNLLIIVLIIYFRGVVLGLLIVKV